MIKTGIDIVQISRIKINNPIYLSPLEKTLFSKFSNQKKQVFLAGRFGLKEALYKALPEIGRDFSKISILYNELNQPVVAFKNYKISLSMAHDGNYVVASCVVLKGNK